MNMLKNNNIVQLRLTSICCRRFIFVMSTSDTSSLLLLFVNEPLLYFKQRYR